MAASRLCNFVRFQHVGGGCGGVFCRNWLKLRITFQPSMQKARVVEQKTQGSFVDSRETMWRSQSEGRGLNCLLDLLI